MKDFFKSLLAVVLGNLISFTAVCAVMFFFFIAAILLLVGAKPDAVSMPDNAFLVLDLNMTISDTPDQRAGSLRGLLNNSGARIGLWDLTSALNTAAQDDKVRGILVTGSLEFENYGSGFAALAETRRALLDFKKTGKPVLAYLESPSLKDYYLASAADTLLLHPHALLDVRGLASENFYLGNAFKKYGIGVQTTKVGEYKSAVEPFISDKMSDADRKQRQAFLDGIWKDIAADITAARGLPSGAFVALTDKHGVLDADSAKEYKLVDELAYLDEVIETLKKLGAADPANGSFAQINVRDYAQNTPSKSASPVIAIVYAEGDIVDGSGALSSEDGIADGSALAARLRELRQDGDVVAVVLRVNSPGGSAFASEVIQRETRLFSPSGKPFIVSMGSLAASGGYWISAYADKIFAEKTTLTGSIGVFGLMFNIEEAARNIGVNFEAVKTSRFADIETLSRPKTPEELALLQRHTDKIYDAFMDKVSEGRKLKRAQVEKIAGGRVWTGRDALRLGLVDAEGGLREAVRHAISLVEKEAGKKFTIQQYPERRTALEMFVETLQQPEHAPPVARALTSSRGNTNRGATAKLTRLFDNFRQQLERLNDRNGIYARLPYWETE
jgi:protease-4